MPFINLIEEQRLAARANERKARLFFSLFAGAVVLSGGAYGFLTIQAAMVAGDAAAVDLQNQKNAPLVKQIQDNGNTLAELSPRLKTLEDASVVTDRWNRILEHLSVQTPKEAYLTTLHCEATDPQKPITITFSGIAPSQAPVGEFMLRLQNQPDMANVNLRGTNEKMTADTRAIEFQIDAELVGTADQKVKVEQAPEGDKK